MRISILGYYGVPNIGDEAILTVLLQRLKDRFPNSSIAVSARDQSYLRQKHSVDSYPLEQGIPSFLAGISQSDLLLVGGGGILFDTPLQVLPFWLKRVAWSRCAGIPPILYSVGVGPITKKASKHYLRLGLRFASLISVRDKLSARLLRDCGIRDDISLLPDLAFLLLPASETSAREILYKEGIPETPGIKMAITLRHWPAFDGDQQFRFLSQIARAMDELRLKHDITFILVPFQYRSETGDLELMNELASICKCRDSIHVVKGQYSPEEVKAIIGQMDVTLGMRLHSVVFSQTMGVPCVGLSYADKITSHMKMFDSEDLCLPIHTVKWEEIVDLVEDVIREKKQISSRLRSAFREIAKDAICLHDGMLSRLEEMT